RGRFALPDASWDKLRTCLSAVRACKAAVPSLLELAPLSRTLSTSGWNAGISTKFSRKHVFGTGSRAGRNIERGPSRAGPGGGSGRPSGLALVRVVGSGEHPGLGNDWDRLGVAHRVGGNRALRQARVGTVESV